MRPDPTAGDDERGFTLIEVLITVALISIAFIGILSAVGAMITAGAENTNAATSLTAVRNLAAFMQSQLYQPCNPAAGATAQAYNLQITAGFTPPTGYAASVSAVDAWNGDTPASFVKGPDGITPDTQGTCPAGGDHGLEQLTLSIAPPSGQLGAVATRTITILKRSTS